MAVWTRLSGAIGAVTRYPSNEFTSYLKAEYPRRLAPVVAMWLNEVKVLDYAKEIDASFEGKWVRIPTSHPVEDNRDHAAEHISSRDVALSPSVFMPAEPYVLVCAHVEGI